MRRIGVSLSVTLLVGVPYLGLNACGGSSEIKYVEAGAGDAGDTGGATGGSSAGGASGRGGTGGAGGRGGTSSTGGTSSSSGGSSGDDSGGSSGMAGSAGEGGAPVDPGCLETGCPVGRYCDGDSRTCEPLKTAGEECARSQQCDDLLDCLDGVCCEERECPACQNCGSDGTCSVTVTDAEDTTGSECEGSNACDAEGSCRHVLGEECNGDSDCVSGNCIDAVCCEESACPECMNCGSDGTCNVPIRGEDDVTSSCNGEDTCAEDGACIERWRLVGATLVTGAFGENYTATIGNIIYFANASNESATQYHKGFDVGTSTFSDVALMNNEYCACGYEGVAVTDGSRIYYFANGGVSLTPGATSWVDVAGYTSSAFYDGESATAYVDGRIYRISGRQYPDRVAYYNVTSGTYVTTGLASHPELDATYRACAGAANGKIYVFGWARVVSEYDPAANVWSTGAEDPNAPEYCSGQNIPSFQDQLVYAYNGVIKRFNAGTGLWESEDIPLPTTGLEGHKAMVAAGNLYVLAYRRSDRNVVVYRYAL